jgi:LysM repeat protein
LGAAAQLENEVRTLAGRTQVALNALSRDVGSLREQVSNSMARVKGPKAQAAAKKDEKSEQPLDPNGTYHTIKPGDFLSRVAKQYSTTVEAIEKLNPGLDSKHMQLGQKIRVK